MIRAAAAAFGILFLIAGFLGFFPTYAPNNNLLGCFHSNPTHNIIHIATGIVAVWTGFTSQKASRIFFKFFGIIYILAATLGLYYGKQPIFGLIANNMADVGLHFAVGVIALALGFGCACTCKK